VIEEYSDVLVAGSHLMRELEPFCGYDIHGRIAEIATEKVRRFEERMRAKKEITNG
jgi:hypothetical protein